LIQSVLEHVGADAYPSASQSRQAAFKHDRENLKHRLQVGFIFDSVKQSYSLEDAGPYGGISLSPKMLRALSILSRQYENVAEDLLGVRDLVQMIVGWLPLKTRMQIELENEYLAMDFEHGVDQSKISSRVGEIIQRAVNQHRKLTFNYLSPRRADRQSVFHEIAPYQIRFQGGHWYLRGYSLNPSAWDETTFLRFRISYIVDDEQLKVLPTKVETHHRKPPRFRVHYWLAPEIGRGEISHRFEEIQITRNADGSAEVQAVTDDVWDAARTLLTYGESCIVLGGNDLLQETRKRVKQMAKNYNFYNEET